MDLLSEDSDEAARACRHAGSMDTIHILSRTPATRTAHIPKSRFTVTHSHCFRCKFLRPYPLYRSIIGSASGRAQVLASRTVFSSRAASWMACMMSSTW